MARYRVYYCTEDGKRFAADEFTAADDAGAIERGRKLAGLRAPVFGIWHGDRLVFRGGTYTETAAIAS